MSRELTKGELIRHKEAALSSLEQYLDSLINNPTEKINAKADKLSYWIKDWSTFLDYEAQFNPIKLRRYKRGEIIKVHLGYNIGNEEGGLHYAVVIEKNNPKTSGVVTIVPLTSAKPHTDIAHLKGGSIFLGNELFTSLSAKISSTEKHLTEEISVLNDVLSQTKGNDLLIDLQDVLKRITDCEEELKFLQRMRREISKMKQGSIALIGQITTVSKIRIYDPKTDHDVLSGIKLSNEKLDLIDAEILNRFTK